MKKILLFGAGKSATVLIDYLLRHSESENWTLTVVDASLELAQNKVGNAVGGVAVSFDVADDTKRRAYISESDIVISLLPPTLHFLAAKDCVAFGRNLLTASYVDEQMKSLQPEIEKNGLLFLCEMGLDPGIDHMSAKKMIDEIQSDGGTITSFLSHCGGLVAPESDDNPWHYKISWNPKNVVMAGKAGAVFTEKNSVVNMDYDQLFSEKRFVEVPGGSPLCWYPNRNSLPYAAMYNLHECQTFIRTTLRHPDFIYGWKNIIDLKLTGEEPIYETNGKTLMDFFKDHMQKNDFQDWLQQKIQDQILFSKQMLEDLVKLTELENEKEASGTEAIEEFMVVTEKGDLEEFDMDELKTSAATTIASKMHEAKLTLKQLFFLGMDDDQTSINKGFCSAADVLQLALEKKLALLPGDKDRVVMIHEIEWEKEGKKFKNTSSLILDGENDHYTAMAKTVGLPLGIAAKLILNGTIKRKGLQIPVMKEIYEPVLNELSKNGVAFLEQSKEL